MPRFCYKLLIEYDGTDFHGWQLQPGKRTVQREISRAIEAYSREKIKLEGAGRTDSGVHAVGQVASFCLGRNFEVDELRYRLNRILPDDIAIKKVSRTSGAFDPRRQAMRRTYRYYISESSRPLLRHMCFEVQSKLDILKLNRAAEVFLGRHDFTSFCKQKSLKGNNHCRIYLSKWFRYRGLLVYEVKADRFLHHMVRRMVGAMLAVESSKLNLTQLRAFVNNKSNVKYSVPAKGLVLLDVTYRREKQ